jgi:hypothetical protein
MAPPVPTANSRARRAPPSSRTPLSRDGPVEPRKRRGIVTSVPWNRAATATRGHRHAGTGWTIEAPVQRVLEHPGRADAYRVAGAAKRAMTGKRARLASPAMGPHGLIGGPVRRVTVRRRGRTRGGHHLIPRQPGRGGTDTCVLPLGRARFGPDAGLRERVGPRHARPKPGCAWLWSRGAWLVLPGVDLASPASGPVRAAPFSPPVSPGPGKPHPRGRTPASGPRHPRAVREIRS